MPGMPKDSWNLHFKWKTLQKCTKALSYLFWEVIPLKTNSKKTKFDELELTDI